MKRLATPLLALALALPATAPVAQAHSVTVTGANGGTIQRDRDCSRSSGTARCTVSGTATGPNGQIATRERVRTTTAGSSSTTVTGAGPQGSTTYRARRIIVTR